MISNQPRPSLPRMFGEPKGDVSWYSLTWKLYKHHLSIAPGLLLCMCAIILGSVCSDYIARKNLNTIQVIDTLLPYCYEIGLCIGGIVIGFSRRTWSSRQSNYVIGAILFITCSIGFRFYFERDSESMSFDAIIHFGLVQFLCGSCYVFAYITTLTHIADNVYRNDRGHIVTNITAMFIVTNFIDFKFRSKIISSDYYILFIVAIIISATILNWLCTFDSITIDLKKSQAREAEHTLLKLSNGTVSPVNICDEINEKIKMMHEDYGKGYDGCEIFSDGNWKPLLLLILLRLYVVIMGKLSYVGLMDVDDWDYFEYVLLASCLLAVLVSKFSLDSIGRNRSLIIGSFGCVFYVALLIIKYLSGREINYIPLSMTMVVFKAIAYYFGIDPVNHVYSSEAFPLPKRNASLAVIVFIERIGHIVAYQFAAYQHFEFPAKIIFGLCAIIISMLTALIWNLPETKRKPIRECRADFNNYYKRFSVENVSP